MLTIFTAPKPFRGHLAIIQDNAIRSWARLRPAPKIVLFGEDAVSSDAARDVGAQVVARTATNTHGTPLVPDIFRAAEEMAAGDVLAFVNADILLCQRVVEAVGLAASWSRRFLLVAQRIDVDVRARFDFEGETDPRWISLRAQGSMHPAGGIDLFAYRRGQYTSMPPFAIGRTAYDNWLLWYTVKAGVPLIDATEFVTLVHQNHDYGHLPGVDVWNGAEAQENRKLIQHWSHYYTIMHSNWKLTATGEIVRATDLKYRMARPRRILSHAIRATRPLRRRIYSWRLARRFKQ